MMIRTVPKAVSLNRTHIGRRRIRLWVTLLVFAVVIGAIYGAAVTAIPGHPAELGAVRGAVTGAIVGGLIGWFEISVVNGDSIQLRQLPFAWLLLVKEVAYVSFILGGDWLGGFLIDIGGAPGFGF